jgi:archaellum biogenesis protein FlaJ (TadC family)
MNHKNYVFILHIVVCLFLGYLVYIILTNKEITNTIAILIIMLIFLVIIHLYFYFSKNPNNREKYDFSTRKRKEDNIIRLKQTRDFDLEPNDNDFGDITESKVI